MITTIVLINLIAAYIYIDGYYINPGSKTISKLDINSLLVVDLISAGVLLFLYWQINKKSHR